MFFVILLVSPLKCSNVEWDWPSEFSVKSSSNFGGMGLTVLFSPLLEKTHPLTPTIRAPQITATTWIVTAIVWTMVTISAASYASSPKNINEGRPSDKELERKIFVVPFCSIHQIISLFTKIYRLDIESRNQRLYNLLKRKRWPSIHLPTDLNNKKHHEHIFH